MRARVLLCVMVLVVLVLPVFSQQTVENTVTVTIYNNSSKPVYNGAFHIVLTPSNATFPINLDTLYVTLDNGKPIYYTYDLEELDIKQFYAVEPGVILNGVLTRYTTTQPASDWYTTSYDDSSWNTGYTPFGNYTNTTAYYIYSQIFDQGHYTMNNPRTELNITTLWVRAYTKTIPSGYRLYRAYLGIAYLGCNFTAYINGVEVANLSTIPKANITTYLYNASVTNDIAVVDITKYINTTSKNLVAIFINESQLPSYVARLFDFWVVYELVPDYSNYLSLWVKIPYIPPNGYQVIVIHYNVLNIYPQYHSTSSIFYLYDTFSYTNSNWLWSNTTDYIISDSLLIHNYTLGRSGVLWYPLNIDNFTALYIRTAGFSTETIPYGDISLLVTNETNPVVDFTNTTEAYVSQLLGGGIINLYTYNYSSGYIQGIGVPVYVNPIIISRTTNTSETIITIDNTTNANYTLTAPSGHYINKITFIGIDIKGYGALEYIAVYNSAENYTIKTGLPPNYIPPQPSFSGEYVKIYLSTNGTVYLSLNNPQVYKFNTTLIRVGFLNNSFIRIVYVGEYASSPDELRSFLVSVYGDNSTFITNITFVPTETNNHVVVEYTDINVTMFKQVEIYIYDYNTRELLKILYIDIPKSMLMYGYLNYLAYIIPFALLIALTIRGNLKAVALGFIVYGIICFMLPYIGIDIPYSMAVSAIAILFGLVLAFISR